MGMRYHKELCKIKSDLQYILKLIKDAEKSIDPIHKEIIKRYGVSISDKSDIENEIEAIRYMIACTKIVRKKGEKPNKKPRLIVALNAFEREIKYLCHIYELKEKDEKMFPSWQIEKVYKTCHYYLDRFSRPVWYMKLPEKIG